jgi:hypothetical protein
VDEHISIGREDVFLTKFDAAGAWQWAGTWGGTGTQSPAYDSIGYGVDVDSAGNPYVAGGFMGICDFDPGPGSEVHGTDPGTDSFVSKFDAQGVFQWVLTWDTPSGVVGVSDLVLNESGSIHITGSFSGEVDFDPGPSSDIHTSGSAGWDAFLSKYDSTGSYEWTRIWGGGACNGTVGLDVATDDLDNIFIAGIFAGKCEFNPDGGYTYESHGDYDDDVFLSDSSGSFQWATAFGGIYPDLGRGVAASGDGNVFITGYFADTVDLDPGSGEYKIESNGYRDVFLIKYAP